MLHFRVRVWKLKIQAVLEEISPMDVGLVAVTVLSQVWVRSEDLGSSSASLMSDGEG